MSIADTPPLREPSLFLRPRECVELRKIVRLATPITLVSLVNMAISVTDTLMSAALGREALAAVAVGSDFYSILFYFAAGTLGGLAPLYAAAHAEKDGARLDRLRSAAWALAGLLAALAAIVIWTAPGWLRHLGIDASLLAQGASYTKAMAVTIVPMLAAAVLRTRLTAIERPGALLRVTLMAVPLNAGLNYVLMFGIGGWPGLGATGAGLSSLAVGLFYAGALIHFDRRAGDRGRAVLPRLGEVVEIARLGFPIGIATIAEVGVFLGATLFVATLGVDAAAAHALAIRIAGITYAVSVGLQQAAMVRFARSAAAERRQHSVVVGALRLGAAAGLLVCVALIGAARPLAVMTVGPAEAVLSAQLILLLAAAELFTPLGAAAAGLLRGRKETRPVMVYAMIGNWGVAVPLGLILSATAGLGAAGVWIGLSAGAIVAAGLTTWHLFRPEGRSGTKIENDKLGNGPILTGEKT